MKTNRICQLKTLRFLSLIVGTITVVSCGSYQNSSYYDDDGVYGPDNSDKAKRVVQNETSSGSYSNAYAQQFKSMKEEFGPTEVLTDVDNYKSAPDTVYVQENGTRYGGWGENPTNNNIVIVNDNWGWNNWGMNGWGMNGWGWNGWYGNNWGMNGWGWNGWYGNNWGMNGWGWNGWYGNGWYGNGWGWYGNNWGMNGWGWNGWYGGGRNVVINNGPRGGYINNNGNSGRLTSGRVGNSIGSPRTQIGQTRGNSIGTPRTQTSEPRTFTPRGNTNTGTPRAPISDPRTYNPRGNTNTGTPRTQTSEPRTYTPRNDSPRNEAPRTISTPRSSDFGGGRSSGGFGGGGSTGGGGRSGGGGRGGR
jgi:hypothetical protein